MNLDNFSNELVKDLKNIFQIVRIEEDSLLIINKNIETYISLKDLYNDYEKVGYNNTLEKNIKLIENILIENKLDIDYNNVYPIIKHENFGKSQTSIEYIREKLFEDIDMLFVMDKENLFRFILKSDGLDEIKLKSHALNNLNKLGNSLSKLTDGLEIYSLRFMNNYAATQWLCPDIQKQILKKVGNDVIFALNSSTTMLVGKYNRNNVKDYIKIMKNILLIDKNPDKISSKIYRYKNGIYSTISD
jgi:hypothetical protein